MLPDLDSIACFVAAARTLNFRAAAKTAALTPAAFGKRIKQLEEQLDNRLFERTTRHVSLTVAGQRFLPEARRLLNVAEQCVRTGRGKTGPAPTRLTIGTRHELGISWLVPMLAGLHADQPHLDVDFYFGSGPDLEERVRRFDIQCAVTSRVFVDPIFDAIRLKQEDYVFVGSRALLSTVPFECPEDAAAHCLIDVQVERPLYRYFRDAADAPDELHFGNSRVMGTTAAIRMLVLAGEGIAVLPYYLVKPDIESGQLQQVFPDVQLRCDYFRLIYRRDDPQAEMYQAVAAFMRTRPLT